MKTQVQSWALTSRDRQAISHLLHSRSAAKPATSFPSKFHLTRFTMYRQGPARAGLVRGLLVGSGRSPGAEVGVLVGRSSSCAYA